MTTSGGSAVKTEIMRLIPISDYWQMYWKLKKIIKLEYVSNCFSWSEFITKHHHYYIQIGILVCHEKFKSFEKNSFTQLIFKMSSD
jgi:hypothetical protein